MYMKVFDRHPHESDETHRRRVSGTLQTWYHQKQINLLVAHQQEKAARIRARYALDTINQIKRLAYQHGIELK